MNEWRLGTISELAEIFMGQSPSGTTTNTHGDGKPLLNGPSEFTYRSPVPVQWATSAPRSCLAGDVLFCVRGSTTGKLNIADQDYAIGRGLAALRGSTPEDTSFIYYSLQNSLRDLLAGVTGSVFPNLSRNQIGDHEILIPPTLDRRAIAEVLGALDNKIASNTKLAATATSLVQSEFHRLMKSACQETTIGETLALEYGKSLAATKRVPGTVDVFGSGGIVGKHDTALLPGPGVIVGRKGTAGAVHWSPGPYFPIDTTYYAVPRNENISQLFAYFLLRSAKLDEMNSDSAVPGLNRNEAHAAKVKLPTSASIQAFTTSMNPVFQLAAQSERENLALSTTRDALLPQLMSGKLRVKDAEALVSAAV